LKRSFRHWTLRYLANRTKEKIYHWSHPGEPWLTSLAISFLKVYLQPQDVGLEFGSGRSTIWLANRMQTLTSVEHDRDWYDQINKMIKEQQVANIIYLYRPVETGLDAGQKPAYVRVADTFADESLDFVLVDGRYRDQCALAALHKLRPGGLLVLDNADLFLPNQMVTPNARSFEMGAANAGWEKFLQLTTGWRELWTTNGVFSTALFVKR